MDFGKVISWFASHRMFVGVVAIVVVLLAWEFMREQNAHPAGPTSARDLQQTDGQPAGESRADAEKDSIDALFDPSDARTAGKYKLPAKLSTREIRQLAADTSCAEEYWMSYYGFTTLCVNAGEQLVEKREDIFNRVSTGKGFKNENIPTRWRQIMDSDHSVAELIAISPMFLPLKYRFEAVRYHIIGGECTLGDVSFVKWITGLCTTRLLTVGPRLKSVYELEQWMVADGLMQSVDDRLKIGVEYPNFQDYIDVVRKKYDSTAASTQNTPPKK